MGAKKIHVAYAGIDVIASDMISTHKRYMNNVSRWPELTGKGSHMDQLKAIENEYDKIYTEILGLYESVNRFLINMSSGFKGADAI